MKPRNGPSELDPLVSQGSPTDKMAPGLDERSLASTLGSVPAAQRVLFILLVEDNPSNQRLLLRMLQRSGHRVVVADNGKDAVALASSQYFDLIFMDIEMPILDGIKASLEIRALEKSLSTSKKTHIVAMAEHVQEENQQRFSSAGMDGFLQKPIDRAAVARILGEIGRVKVDT